MRLRNIPGAKDAILESPYVVTAAGKSEREMGGVFPAETACSY